MRVFCIFAVLLCSVALLVTGHVDLDWMVVAPRFDGWYFSVDYWEFAPYMKMNWHLAYVFTVVRVAAGWLALGGLIGWLATKLKDSS